MNRCEAKCVLFVFEKNGKIYTFRTFTVYDNFLWRSFFIFLFFLGEGGNTAERLSKFGDKAFRGPLRFKQAICRVQCDRKLTGYKRLKHRLENISFSFLERVTGFHEILSTILKLWPWMVIFEGKKFNACQVLKIKNFTHRGPKIVISLDGPSSFVTRANVMHPRPRYIDKNKYKVWRREYKGI